jgi:hypothetical protein
MASFPNLVSLMVHEGMFILLLSWTYLVSLVAVYVDLRTWFTIRFAHSDFVFKCSPNAILYVTLRFGIEVPYQKIETFRKAVEVFVKARPREWVSMLGFRVTSIQTEQGYMEYSLCLMHRESWQNMIPMLNSRHTVQAYCLELSKRLDMRYTSPPLPVEVNTVGRGPPSQVEAVFDFEGTEQQPGGEHQRVNTVGQESTNFSDIARLFAKDD